MKKPITINRPVDRLLLLRDPALLRPIKKTSSRFADDCNEPVSGAELQIVSEPILGMDCIDQQGAIDNKALKNSLHPNGKIDPYIDQNAFLATLDLAHNTQLSAVATVRMWLEEGSIRAVALVAQWIVRVLVGSTGNPTEEHHGAAKRALQREANRNDSLAAEALESPEACDRLARGLLNAFHELMPAIGMNLPGPCFEQEAEEIEQTPDGDQILAYDERLARWLSTRWDTLGDQAADMIRQCARDHRRGQIDQPSLPAWWAEPKPGLVWTTWIPKPDDDPLVLKVIARLIWMRHIHPWWKKERDQLRYRRAALVRAVVADEILVVQTKQAYLPGLDDGLIRDNRGRTIARIVDGAPLVSVREGLELLGTVTGHRLIRALVHRGYDQWDTNKADFRAVQFDGGWSAVAKAVKYKTRDWSILQKLAKAGQHVDWQAASGHQGGGWWTFTTKRGARGNPGWVRFILGDAILPGYADTMTRLDKAKSHTSRSARRLIPELRYEPPVSILHERSHGHAWTLQRLFMLEMVDNAEELYRNGAIILLPKQWNKLAQKAGLPPNTISRLLSHWIAGEDENAPPLLQSPDRDAWTLADSYKFERDFIHETGRNRVEGRINARKGKARKHQKKRGKT